VTYANLVDDGPAAVRSALAGDSEGIAVATSGSSGTPRDVLVSGAALRASADATHRRLGGPGRWLLALPTDRIAGAQVLVRSALSGTTPVVMPPGPFEAQVFSSKVRDLVSSTEQGVPLYASLVPTQLRRVLASAEATSALETLTAVLVGGASPGALVAPANVIETYGATETAGGCVYDGIPLDGVTLRVGDDGRIWITGPTLADGYADGDDATFVLHDGRRWFVTNDVGDERNGRLEVEGRADDVIVTGGHKVHPLTVEAALAALDGIGEVVVVGVPDPEWGTRLVALVDPPEVLRAPTTEQVRAALKETLPRYAVPREVREVDSIPLLASGKIDRRAAALLARQSETTREEAT
jgi:o-succinylbenzoate---CoA ligase